MQQASATLPPEQEKTNELHAAASVAGPMAAGPEQVSPRHVESLPMAKLIQVMLILRTSILLHISKLWNYVFI